MGSRIECKLGGRLIEVEGGGLDWFVKSRKELASAGKKCFATNVHKEIGIHGKHRRGRLFGVGKFCTSV